MLKMTNKLQLKSEQFYLSHLFRKIRENTNLKQKKIANNIYITSLQKNITRRIYAGKKSNDIIH